MTSETISAGNHAVVINGLGETFAARLYVNARNGIANADATLLHGSFKTITGARRWAKKRLAA